MIHRRRRMAGVLTAAWVAACIAACASTPKPAEVVYVSGRIYTVDPRNLWVEAVAIRDGRFTRIGSNARVLASIDPHTKIVDLKGAFVMPALYDPDDRHAEPGAVSLFEQPDPWTAMERRRIGGPPDSGAIDAGNGSGSIDMPAIVRAYTIDAARARGQEREAGSIERGKRANFVVLDRNLFDVAPAEISETRVLETVIDGQTLRGDG